MNDLRYKKCLKGFSLPEVLVALSIFAVVGVVFTAALGSNFKVLLMADRRTTAETVAKAQLEAISNAGYFSNYDNVTISTPAGYYISKHVDLVDPETGHDSTAGDLGMQKVTVTVSCPSPTEPVIVISSYKRDKSK